MSTIARREIPDGPWAYTDDTQMALSVVEVLQADGQIDPSKLGHAFANRFDPDRGYGAGTAQLLQKVAAGGQAQRIAAASHGGEGSHGNGAAMRVAPLGAYFADDIDRVVREAQASAVATHTHCEAIAGAIAVAVAAALATKVGNGLDMNPTDFLKHILLRTPESLTRNGINTSITSMAVPILIVLLRKLDPDKVIRVRYGSIQLWCAAHNLRNYEDAFGTP